MLANLLMLVLGLLLVIKGCDWFVGASVRLAELLRMARVVIGSTLVSLATVGANWRGWPRAREGVLYRRS